VLLTAGKFNTAAATGVTLFTAAAAACRHCRSTGYFTGSQRVARFLSV